MSELSEMKQLRPAYIRWYGKIRGQERRAVLRSGRKGRGYAIQVVWYWPDSGSSIEGAARIFDEVADREGFMIIGSDRGVQE